MMRGRRIAWLSAGLVAILVVVLIALAQPVSALEEQTSASVGKCAGLDYQNDTCRCAIARRSPAKKHGK